MCVSVRDSVRDCVSKRLCQLETVCLCVLRWRRCVCVFQGSARAPPPWSSASSWPSGPVCCRTGPCAATWSSTRSPWWTPRCLTSWRPSPGTYTGLHLKLLWTVHGFFEETLSFTLRAFGRRFSYQAIHQTQLKNI